VEEIVIKVLVFQVIVAVIVIFILKKILDHQLEQLAIKKLEYIKLDAQEQGLQFLTLVAPGQISLSVQQRISALCKKKFGHPVQLVLKKDRTLKGGLVIQLTKTVIDYSLVGRLKEGGVIR
jgi:F0F1-type ATP synthase delta subunit